MWLRSTGGGVRSRPPSAWPSTSGSYACSACSSGARRSSGGSGGGAVEDGLLGLAQRGEMAAGAAEARVGEHPLQQLLGRLGGHQLVELLDLLAGQHQPRLELEQRRDQDQELGRRLQVELVARLEVVEVGEHDLGQLDLEQVELLAQDQREQQVERAREDVEVELQPGDRGGGHAPRRVGICAADQRRLGRRTGPTPIASRTSASVAEAIARAFSAPASSASSSAASSARSSS